MNNLQISQATPTAPAHTSQPEALPIDPQALLNAPSSPTGTILAIAVLLSVSLNSLTKLLRVILRSQS